MKKLLWITCALLLLVACTNDTKLSDAYDEETLEAKSVDAVTAFLEGAYGTLRTMGDDNFKKALTDEALDGAKKVIEPAGKWIDISELEISGLKKDDTDYAVAVLKVHFEKGSHVFTVIFAPESVVTGFFVK